MANYISAAGLQIDQIIYDLVNNEIAPGTGITPEHFWDQFAAILADLAPKNRALLQKREDIQAQIDAWHKQRAGQDLNFADYKAFLEEIGYLAHQGDDFAIETQNVDAAIATIAGPQLVVPITNARFSLNAANARWGSLYDALYGTDVIPQDANQKPGYDPERGAKVIAYARNVLNQAAPLATGSYNEATGFKVEDGQLIISLNNGDNTVLSTLAQFVGYRGDATQPTSILLKHNELHLEIVINADHTIGATDPAHIADVVLESAITAIQDCEDSVACVDAEDKAVAYRNWNGLMQGNLHEEFEKAGKSMKRVMNADRTYTSTDGSELSLQGRSTLLVRNVGHLMTNPAILCADGNEVPEGIMDGMITCFAALHDLQGNSPYKNSPKGSVYIVKPKMHGPEEVAFTVELFGRIETALGMVRNTLKVGIMDEERRTTINLKECIRAAKERLIFINTGFLDRTGDEIHTSMEAGPVVRKGDMKQSTWIGAYENNNVDVGLRAGLRGKAQIGKGMWAMPDLMAKMMVEKIGHPQSGANCAWVPSPTAATLHVMHYHQVNVAKRQAELADRTAASNDDILQIPLHTNPETMTAEEIQNELDNNVQGMLGYVVRWVDQGVGCSKVPDINDVGLMEDRATLRISSQHLCNWLHHGICTAEQITETMARMAAIVDQQNANDPLYRPMADNLENNIAFQAARELVFDGCVQPSGYTEPALHRARLAYKAKFG